MCRPHCGMVDARQAEHLDAGEVAPRSPPSAASASPPSRRRRSPTARAARPRAMQVRRSACRAPIRSSARPSPESRARRTPLAATEKPAILLYGFGMIPAPVGEHAHVEAVQVVGAVGLERHALLARRRRACARGSKSRASGCSASGTPSAAAAHWRVWSSGVAPMPPQENTTSPLANASLQVGGDALAVVADVARPGEREAARREQLDHLGQVLVGALAGEDLVADDDRGRSSCGDAAAAGSAGERRQRLGRGRQRRRAPRPRRRAARCSAASR